jgi:hypothetical protein
MRRMKRDEEKQAFTCNFCGLTTRMVNGKDIFDQTKPIPLHAPIARRALEAQSQNKKFRVVIEEFDTAEEAVEFRNKLNRTVVHKRAHIEMELSPRDWRIWTFK